VTLVTFLWWVSSEHDIKKTGYVPKDAYDIVALVKTIGICTNEGIVTADPIKSVFLLNFFLAKHDRADICFRYSLTKSAIALVPDFKDASNNPAMGTLKDRIEGLKPLGLVKVDTNEFLVVYDGNQFRRVQFYFILTFFFLK